MVVKMARISPNWTNRWTIGGPRQPCGRPGCDFVFVGDHGTAYCSPECAEMMRREREAERKRRRRAEGAAALRSV
jgi:hypothetical protein